MEMPRIKWTESIAKHPDIDRRVCRNRGAGMWGTSRTSPPAKLVIILLGLTFLAPMPLAHDINHASEVGWPCLWTFQNFEHFPTHRWEWTLSAFFQISRGFCRDFFQWVWPDIVKHAQNISCLHAKNCVIESYMARCLPRSTWAKPHQGPFWGTCQHQNSGTHFQLFLYLTAFGIPRALWPSAYKAQSRQGLCKAGWCKRWFA